MKLLLLGRGKTGKLVEEVARERGHDVTTLGSKENPHASALTKEKLSGVAVVIDFTTPQAVLENIAACAQAGANMVVGTTGWYAEMGRVRELVEKSGTGLLFAANFSVGVNIFFEIARASVPALTQGYSGFILERHHAQKKDAPSGTAAALQKIIESAGGGTVEISSIREGDIVGQHMLLLQSENDSLMLTHDAKSRRGFAEGAVRGAEWLAGKRGFFDFKDVFRELK